MTEDLLRNIQERLHRRWEALLPRIIDRARNFASAANGRLQSSTGRDTVEKALQEAYAFGYREGYWDGILDVVECAARHEHSNPSKTNANFFVH